MKKFVKAEDLKLVGPGYLTVGGDANNAVTNDAFVAAQKRAEYVVTFARHCEGKDFEGKKATTIAEIRKAVSEELSATSTKYVDVPEKA